MTGLLLDLGGVLTSPVRGSFEAFCAEEGIVLTDLSAAVGVMLGEPDADHPVARLESGTLPVAEFDAWLAAELSTALHRSFVPDGLAHRLVSNVSLDERMFDAVRRARAAGVPTGLLSNSWGNHDYPPLITDLFDAVTVSGAEGMRKPDPAIYRLAAERLGVDPSLCVFVDDVETNCAGAEAVGMRAIHHTDADATIAELGSILGVDLS